MRLSLTIAAAALAALITAPAPAAEGNAFLDCANLTDSAARLACFDGAVARLKQQRAEAPPPAQQPVPPGVDDDGFALFGLTLWGGGEDRSDQMAATDPAQMGREALPETRAPREEIGPRVMVAKPVEVAYDALGKFIVVLENGQVWRQTDSEPAKHRFRREPGENTIEISDGLLGSYNARINGANRLFKVRRVR